LENALYAVFGAKSVNALRASLSIVGSGHLGLTSSANKPGTNPLKIMMSLWRAAKRNRFKCHHTQFRAQTKLQRANECP
jgi:hypothetical protein